MLTFISFFVSISFALYQLSKMHKYVTRTTCPHGMPSIYPYIEPTLIQKHWDVPMCVLCSAAIFSLYNFQSAAFIIFLKFFRSIYSSIFNSPWNFRGREIKCRNYLYFHKDHSSLWNDFQTHWLFLSFYHFLTSSQYLTVFTILSANSHLSHLCCYF